MRARSKGLAWAIVVLLLATAAASRFLSSRVVSPNPAATAGGGPVDSAAAFRRSYLNAAAGIDTSRRTSCISCHPHPVTVSTGPCSALLASRARLGRAAWAEAALLAARCGSCHLVPDPSNLPRESWREAMSRMAQIMETRAVPRLTDAEFQDLLHFYLTFSPATQPVLAADPDPAASDAPLRFTRTPLGRAPAPDPRDHPMLGHVEIADVDRDGRPDVLVCDTENSEVQWIHRDNRGVWQEESLARVPNPARARLLPARAGTPPDILVACLGTMRPADDPVGSVVLLQNRGGVSFTPVTLLDKISRVADAEPADLDGDGDTDILVAAYGFVMQGEVGWLENRSGEAWLYHPIVKKAGAIDVLPADLDGDGRMDFIVLFAQEHEEIVAFLNEGPAGFREKILFKAATPCYGSSGIQLVDLDQDGDLDILYTNGDNLDLPTILPRPYHGVQWLENRGNLDFVWHDLHRCYGAYRAVAADLDQDGRPDIVVATLFNDWSDPRRASLFWLQNVGPGRFVPRGIDTAPTHLISAAVGDLDGDGWPDIVASSAHVCPPYDRRGRVTLWTSRPAGRQP